MRMKVLFQSRKDTHLKIGGDSIQLLKTREYLERLGVYVDVSLEPRPDLSKYDLVHLFNITKIDETYDNVLHARRCKKKVVLSPIYWNIREYVTGAFNYSLIRKASLSLMRFPGMRRVKRVLKPATEKRYDDYLERQRYVLVNSDIVLPNSKMEMDILLRDFPALHQDRVFVVPNGVEANLLQSADVVFNNQDIGNDYILCVGRIEERKNQFRLIKALSGTDTPLVLAGYLANTDYVKRCKKEAGERGNVHFIGEIQHERLGSLYARAKVHALPSWYETPGLANLEAGLMGCNLAISDRGSVREYFGALAYYCAPGDIGSIRAATLQAYYAPRNGELSRLIMQHYTWNSVAQRTLDCYHTIL